MVITRQVKIETRVNGHTLDITTSVQQLVQNSGLTGGVAALFVVGSTAA